jgi:hypothetical protein
MLEGDDALLTWSIKAIPGEGQSVVAQRLADHRSIYLEYEGPVSDNRGQVKRWDAGTYETLLTSEHEVVVRIGGNQLNGVFSFQRTPATDRWQLEYRPAVGDEG